ncbi:MAG: hypothetical protein H5T69_01290 [Chloroflexi bacterium]|nr:hypothetical protein [Chloroflexota bacterium]
MTDRSGIKTVERRAQGAALPVDKLPAKELLPLLQLAHELRSPLAAIQGCLDMILQGYTANNRKLEDDLLLRARDRAAAMLAQVNDFLRLGAVRYSEFQRRIQPVQFLEILARLVPEMRVRARWRGVDLHIELPEALPCVMGTYEDMEHLLSNLISNAIKYTEPGGCVTVRFRADDGGVVGSVADTGVGIPAEDLPKIFEEFYRGQRAKEMDATGTGLGLSIVKRVVEIYGGTLGVESVVGQGTTFTFTFPPFGAVDDLRVSDIEGASPARRRGSSTDISISDLDSEESHDMESADR